MKEGIFAELVDIREQPEKQEHIVATASVNLVLGFYALLSYGPRAIAQLMDKIETVAKQVDQAPHLARYLKKIVQDAPSEQLAKKLEQLLDNLDAAVLERLLGRLPEDKLDELVTDLADNPTFRRALTQNEGLVDSWKELDDLGETALKTDVDWLKRVDDWDGAGVQLSKNGDNLKLSDGSGNALGKFKNGDLLPEKYDFPVNASSTPVGDVNNGYQVFKDGSGNLSVRRVPDKSPYSASELTKLTQHPNVHVLERHGHDVTDDALIKRAQTPSVAPDGKVANNPPPHSSKFNSADDLKEGLNNTKPGTTAFNHGVQQGNTKIVTYTSPKVLGKGVPRNGSSFVNMQKVKAIYRDVGGGNYQLITMYPEL